MNSHQKQSPLQKVVFLQRICLFACNKPKRILKLCYTTQTFRETILHYSLYLLLKPFLAIPMKHLQLHHPEAYKHIVSNMKKFYSRNKEAFENNNTDESNTAALNKCLNAEIQDFFINPSSSRNENLFSLDMTSSGTTMMNQNKKNTRDILEYLTVRSLRRFFYFVFRFVSRENHEIVVHTKKLIDHLLKGDAALMMKPFFNYYIIFEIFCGKQATFAHWAAENTRNPDCFKLLFCDQITRKMPSASFFIASHQSVLSQQSNDSPLVNIIEPQNYWRIPVKIIDDDSAFNSITIKNKLSRLLTTAAAAGNLEVVHLLCDREFIFNFPIACSVDKKFLMSWVWDCVYPAMMAAQKHNQLPGLKFLFHFFRYEMPFDPVRFIEEECNTVSKVTRQSFMGRWYCDSSSTSQDDSSSSCSYWRNVYRVLRHRVPAGIGRPGFLVFNFLNRIFMNAVRSNQVEIVQYFLDDLNLFSPTEELFGHGHEQYSPFDDNSKKAVSNRSEFRRMVNMPNSYGRRSIQRGYPRDGARCCNAFEMSIEFGSYEVFQFLIRRASDIASQQRQEKESQPLLFVPSKLNEEIITRLTRGERKSKHLEKRSRDHPLHFCVNIAPKVSGSYPQKPSSHKFSNDFFRISFQMAKEILLAAEKYPQELFGFSSVSDFLNRGGISAFDWRPIHNAAYRCRPDLAKLFIYFGSDVNFEMPRMKWNTRQLVGRGLRCWKVIFEDEYFLTQLWDKEIFSMKGRRRTDSLSGEQEQDLDDFFAGTDRKYIVRGCHPFRVILEKYENRNFLWR